MTTTASNTTSQGGVRPAAQVRLAEQVRLAVLFRGTQTDVTVPAGSPVAAVVAALIDVLQTREGDGEEGVRTPDDDGMVSAGRVTLTFIDGRPLDRTQSLAQQGVSDGDLLVLEVADTDIEFTPIIEAPSTAVAVLGARRFTAVTEQTARVFAAIALAGMTLLTTGLLALVWWRGVQADAGWNVAPAVITAVLGLVLLGSGGLVWWRRADAVMANALWLSGAAILPAAAMMAVPGHPGEWHALFGAATALTVAAVLWRLAAGPRGVLAWVTMTTGAALAMSLLYVLGIALFYVWVVALAVALWTMVNSATFAGWMARIPVPPFPTVTGKDAFTDADHMAHEALIAAEHSGTPSVAELTRGADAANTYLTAMLASTAVFFIGGAVGVGWPGRERWWLATLYVLIIAAILVFRGRAFAYRVQAIIVVATGLVMLAVTVSKYALAWDSAAVGYWTAGITMAFGVLALVIAAAVPARVFSPVFRKLVEWFEYVLIVLVPPIAVWLCNLFYLARNH